MVDSKAVLCLPFNIKPLRGEESPEVCVYFKFLMSGESIEGVLYQTNVHNIDLCSPSNLTQRMAQLWSAAIRKMTIMPDKIFSQFLLAIVSLYNNPSSSRTTWFQFLQSNHSPGSSFEGHHETKQPNVFLRVSFRAPKYFLHGMVPGTRTKEVV